MGYTGSVAHYSQHKSEAYMLITAVTNESFWLAHSQTFIFSDAHSLTFLARFSPHSEILWNWSRLICSYKISIIHLPASTDIIGGFADLLTRDPASLKQTLQEKIGRLRVEDTPMLSFYGLAPMPVQDVLNILTRFMTFYDKMKLNSKEVKCAWQKFAAAEAGSFPAVPRLTVALAAPHRTTLRERDTVSGVY